MKILPISISKDIDKYFYNREKDIKKINNFLSLLDEDIPNQLLITGYRGVGKTLLLKKILKEQPNKYLTTYMDLSNIYGRESGKLTEEEVIKELLNQINQTLIKNNLLKTTKEKIKKIINELKLKDYTFNDNHILDIPIPEIKNNYNKLSKFTMELPQNIVDANDNIKGFIIVIDEFQLLKTINDPKAFFWLIRSYTQKQFNVDYIFTGSVSKTSEIIEMINGQSGAFGGRMIQINVEPFTKEETKNYINEKANEIKFTEKGFERFYACTRGIPIYINTLCTILPNNEVCDEKIIAENLNLNIDYMAIIWLYTWGTLTKIEKEILIFLVENENVTWKTLVDNLKYSKVTVNKYIDSLNNKGIIEYKVNNNYVIADKILKTWLSTKKENEGIYPI